MGVPRTRIVNATTMQALLIRGGHARWIKTYTLVMRLRPPLRPAPTPTTLHRSSRCFHCLSDLTGAHRQNPLEVSFDGPCLPAQVFPFASRCLGRFGRPI